MKLTYSQDITRAYSIELTQERIDVITAATGDTAEVIRAADNEMVENYLQILESHYDNLYNSSTVDIDDNVHSSDEFSIRNV